MEVTDTESGVSVLGKELGPTNNVDIELMAKEMDYSSVKMMLLIMSGLEKNRGPGRTNKETLEFMKNFRQILNLSQIWSLQRSFSMGSSVTDVENMEGKVVNGT